MGNLGMPYPHEEEIAALKAELAEARESYKWLVHRVLVSVNDLCECGGGGPGDCCKACEIYYRIIGENK